jgi:hypothetical protein
MSACQHLAESNSIFPTPWSSGRRRASSTGTPSPCRRAGSSGGFVGLVFIVWVENKRGWSLGFGVCALSVLLGMLVWIAGFPFYRNQLPQVCGALLFNIQVCPLVGLASSPQTTSVDENIETLSGLLYQEIRKPNSSRAEKYLKY